MGDATSSGMKRALFVILLFGMAGVTFSGFLTYRELFVPNAGTCPSPGAPGSVLGYPACVYGFFMYAAIVVAAAIGLARQRAA